MRELKNGTKIIGVDHGYGNIKTANTIMPTGITAYQTVPTFDGNILIYDGVYYRIGEGCGCPVDTSAEGRSTDRGGSRDLPNKRLTRQASFCIYKSVACRGNAAGFGLPNTLLVEAMPSTVATD